MNNSLVFHDSSSRSSEVSYAHGPDQGLDAGHLLSKREGGQEARDHRAQRLRQDIPQRGNTLQHTVSRRRRTLHTPAPAGAKAARIPIINNSVLPLSQNLVNPGLPHGPEAVSVRQASLRPADRQL